MRLLNRFAIVPVGFVMARTMCLGLEKRLPGLTLSPSDGGGRSGREPDRTLVLGKRHLERILRTYGHHYNRRRPHRGLQLATPQPRHPPQDGVGACAVGTCSVA